MRKCRNLLATEEEVAAQNAPETDLEPDDWVETEDGVTLSDLALPAGPICRDKLGLCAMYHLMQHNVFQVEDHPQYDTGWRALPTEGWVNDMSVRAMHVSPSSVGSARHPVSYCG